MKLNNLLLQTSGGNIGIGTTTPTSRLHLIAGAIADGTNALTITGTLPAVPTAAIGGIKKTITGAGSASFAQYGEWTVFGAGYTGSSNNVGSYVTNANAGTGTGTSATQAIAGVTSGAATQAVGVFGRTTGSPTAGVGVWGQSNGGTTTRIGVLGSAFMTGLTTYGGAFFLTSGITPTLPATGGPAALMADNTSFGSNIFIGYDNGTPVFTIKDDGVVNATVSTYADNAAALAGGLVAGDIYRTGTGVLMITY